MEKVKKNFRLQQNKGGSVSRVCPDGLKIQSSSKSLHNFLDFSV
jgi:hypothetical protein